MLIIIRIRRLKVFGDEVDCLIVVHGLSLSVVLVLLGLWGFEFGGETGRD